MWGHAIQFARWQHPAVRLGARFDVPVTTLVSQIVCGRAEFLEAQHCMSSYDLLREASECDRRTEYNWERSQSRRSCQYVIKLVNLSILRRAARYAQHSLQWGHYVSSCLSVPLSFPCQHPARWPYASHAAVGQHSPYGRVHLCANVDSQAGESIPVQKWNSLHSAGWASPLYRCCCRASNDDGRNSSLPLT